MTYSKVSDEIVCRVNSVLFSNGSGLNVYTVFRTQFPILVRFAL